MENAARETIGTEGAFDWLSMAVNADGTLRKAPGGDETLAVEAEVVDPDPVLAPTTDLEAVLEAILESRRAADAKLDAIAACVAAQAQRIEAVASGLALEGGRGQGEAREGGAQPEQAPEAQPSPAPEPAPQEAPEPQAAPPEEPSPAPADEPAESRAPQRSGTGYIIASGALVALGIAAMAGAALYVTGVL